MKFEKPQTSKVLLNGLLHEQMIIFCLNLLKPKAYLSFTIIVSGDNNGIHITFGVILSHSHTFVPAEFVLLSMLYYITSEMLN